MASHGAWMIPELSVEAQFGLQAIRAQIPSMTREELEQKVSELAELSLMREVQVQGALKEFIALTAKVASLEPVQVNVVYDSVVAAQDSSSSAA